MTAQSPVVYKIVSYDIFNRTRGSPILWKAYVLFELAARDLKRAKGVLYRAIQECPLVKGKLKREVT